MDVVKVVTATEALVGWHQLEYCGAVDRFILPFAITYHFGARLSDLSGKKGIQVVTDHDLDVAVTRFIKRIKAADEALAIWMSSSKRIKRC